MKKLVLISLLLFLTICVLMGTHNGTQIDQEKECSQTASGLTITRAATDRMSDIYEQITKSIFSTAPTGIQLYRYPVADCIYVAVYEEEHDWRELAFLVQVDNRKTVTFDDFPSGPIIMNVEFPVLKGFKEPLIAIYDATHEGNGDYSLFAIRGGKPVLLLETFAVDYGLEGRDVGIEGQYGINTYSTLIRGKWLKAAYQDINEDGYDDVILSGSVEYYRDKKGTHEYYPDKERNKDGLLETEPWKKVFIYDKTSNKYKLKKSLCTSLGKYTAFPHYKDDELPGDVIDLSD